ncbi:hypothetical protein DIS10_07170 [Leuconostoc mesenteroides]|nr:hypothetical protein DIS10_07170 [Leuconostoc mesenteroides]
MPQILSTDDFKYIFTSVKLYGQSELKKIIESWTLINFTRRARNWEHGYKRLNLYVKKHPTRDNPVGRF